MALPPLRQDWDTTIHGLHLAAEVLGALRVLAQPHDPHWLELALKPVPEGLSTGQLTGGGAVVLDCHRAALVYAGQNIPLQGATQRSLLDALLPALAKELPVLAGATSEALIESMREGIRQKGHTLLTKDAPPQHEIITLNAQTASDYAHALYAMFTAIARFRGHLKGHMTPIVVFPEHFDLSTLWFVEGDMDEYKAHVNFGFAPFSAGLPRPYLYAYAYPYPPNADYPAVPSPARWHFEGWTGVVVDYDTLTALDEDSLVVLCEAIFQALRPLLV